MSPERLAPPAKLQTSLPDFLVEASRQLTVCNSCRYCEGLCAVFPAIERRTVFQGGDISQIANLCHDCRACFDACMYTAPHDFQINIPQVLTTVRVVDYQRLVWPRRVPSLLSGWSGVFTGSVVSVVVFLIAAAAHVGLHGLVQNSAPSGSPYQVIPYPVLLILMLAPALYAVVVMCAAGRSYWRETGPALQVRVLPVARAVLNALTLRYLRGGGGDCYYPADDHPSAVRRRLHGLVAYGFALCVLSTVSAAFLQDILGQLPPYAVVSVPVISGLAGGISIAVGSAGLLRLKVLASPQLGVRAMTVKDYGFLIALLFLAISGVAVFLARHTAALDLVLLVHLAAVALCFTVAPYSKFMHIVYRFLALVRDAAEGMNSQLRELPDLLISQNEHTEDSYKETAQFEPQLRADLIRDRVS